MSVNWKREDRPWMTHKAGTNGYTYSVTEQNGRVSWDVASPNNQGNHSHGLATDVETAKQYCDTARRLMECLEWLEGARWEEADSFAIGQRLLPFLESAEAWITPSSKAATS